MGLWFVINCYWHTIMQFSINAQRSLNQLLAEQLKQTKVNPLISGLMLVTISFTYGVLHATGPGHGKVIISTYIATHPLRLKKSLVLTLCASLLQGIVAIILVSFVLGLLHLSTKHLQQSNMWIEKLSYLFIVLLGTFLFIRTIKQLLHNKHIKQKPLLIKSIRPLTTKNSFIIKSTKQSNVQTNHCGCGHKHMLSDTDLQGSYRSIFLVIIAMGIRPCSGAILILLLASLLNVYFWGVISTLAMSLGTSLTISIIAIIVHTLRHRALKLADNYQFIGFLFPTLMLLGSILLILMGILLYLGAQATTQPFFLLH